MQRARKVEITKELVDLVRRATMWDVGNQVLYDLCKRYPRHDQVDQIVAKVWLIGRAYSAAIERRRTKTEFLGDAFYTQHVGPKLKQLRIDSWLSQLARHRDVTPD